ncbi:MAG: hypothetical protein F6K21_28115 [Symploca sp. SIO2D2]|nr:hypothetical protein [Symploca sp. SIO2D2]
MNEPYCHSLHKVQRSFLALVVICQIALANAESEKTWAFEPERDRFSDKALLDLRYLNENEAGQTGWVRMNSEGDFTRGDGSSIRFWAVNTEVERHKPYPHFVQPGYESEPDIDQFAQWLAKRGVNMARTHSHINPDPETQDMTEVNLNDVEWIWRTVGAMKKAGIYTTVSPYWANTMKSDDDKWGTDYYNPATQRERQEHHGLLFFDEKLQYAYKEWLRYLFTTPTDYLDGKTLAEEPALAIFQIQNEDSLLFWTFNNLPPEPKKRLGKRFAKWAIEKHGSMETAYEKWQDANRDQDDETEGVLMIHNLAEIIGSAPPQNRDNPRLQDFLNFLVDTMMSFNAEIERFVKEELNCPVLVNAGNWRTADTIYLKDAERYSYTANDVIAANRYFHGIHDGLYKGWAILVDDVYTSKSVLLGDHLYFPLNLKQIEGKAMLVTESTWVFPDEHAFEAPMLISAYSSLKGFDAYYWFTAQTDGFVPPRSANGWNPSQEKWLCLTPDMSGQWPAAALAFRKGYIQAASPVVQEVRSLERVYQRRAPVIAESASYDPNRDAGLQAPDSSFPEGIDPLAFLAGPVTIRYGGNESESQAIDIEPLVKRSNDGIAITSQTGELNLSTIDESFTIDAPKVQALITHKPTTAKLSNVTIASRGERCAMTVISLDNQPIATSRKLLLQLGAPTRPTGWKTESATVEGQEGKRILDYGRAPWSVLNVDLKIEIQNKLIEEAYTLDMNGEKGEALATLKTEHGLSLEFPNGAIYVVAIATK